MVVVGLGVGFSVVVVVGLGVGFWVVVGLGVGFSVVVVVVGLGVGLWVVVGLTITQPATSGRSQVLVRGLKCRPTGQGMSYAMEASLHSIKRLQSRGLGYKQSLGPKHLVRAISRCGQG